jgi:hypothetical protein
MKDNKNIKSFEDYKENLNIDIVNDDKDINSLIKKLRLDLRRIRKEYDGKLTRNTIRDEFLAAS